MGKVFTTASLSWVVQVLLLQTLAAPLAHQQAPTLLLEQTGVLGPATEEALLPGQRPSDSSATRVLCCPLSLVPCTPQLSGECWGTTVWPGQVCDSRGADNMGVVSMHETQARPL